MSLEDTFAKLSFGGKRERSPNLEIDEEPSPNHDTECCNCNRSGVALVSCSVRGCWASWCNSQKCGGRSRGLMDGRAFVCGMCLHEEDPLGDTFDEANKASAKKKLNDAFVRLCSRVHASAVLVLDGIDGQTTGAVLEWKPGALVFAPNPDVAVCERLRELGAESQPLRVGGFLRRGVGTPLQCAWLDFTSTYGGSVTTCLWPRQDAWKLWYAGFDEHAPIVGLVLTVSRRMERLWTESTIVADQIQMAADNGWTATLSDATSYNRQMMQLTFLAKRTREETFNPFLDWIAAGVEYELAAARRSRGERAAVLGRAREEWRALCTQNDFQDLAQVRALAGLDDENEDTASSSLSY
jgi:hypothetical protein